MSKKKYVILPTLLFLFPSITHAAIAESLDELLSTDDLWVLICAALVFFMQAGFKVFETGMVKKEHRVGIGVKNLLDWVAGCIAFFLIGFGFMFGQSETGFFGIGFLFGEGLEIGHTFVFFLFQLAFAGTALTIVSGAMSGRTGLIPYFIASMVTAMIIYPIFGHWAWGDLLFKTNTPWLASLGFIDFAGSSVVHSLGAWVSLVGIWIVGPRLGRYNAEKQIQPMKASDYSYSILGVMILWLGWWGFNGGSTLSFNNLVPKIILNTNLAAAAACVSALFHAMLFQNRKDMVEKITGGTLTGLVAITACCHVVSPQASLLIGAIAGVVHNYFVVIIAENWHLDDPVGAIAVHGFGGVLGTLSVALFGKQELLNLPRMEQLGVQIIGIVTCFVFAASVSCLVFYLLKRSIGLRVSPQDETTGNFFNTETESIVSEDKITENNILYHISAKVSNRGYNVYTIEEYLGLSIDVRSTWAEADRLQYLNEEGFIIPIATALKQLNSMVENPSLNSSKPLKRIRVS